MAKIKIAVCSYRDKSGCSNTAMQIAFYIAHNKENKVAFIDNIKNPLIEKLKLDEDKKKNRVSFYGMDTNVTEDMVVYDLGNISNEYINTENFDKIYIIVDVQKDDFFETEKKLATAGNVDVLICNAAKEDITNYKQIVKRVVDIGDINKTECPYNLKMNLDLFAHMSGLEFPDPDIEYETEIKFKNQMAQMLQKEEDTSNKKSSGKKSFFTSKKDKRSEKKQEIIKVEEQEDISDKHIPQEESFIDDTKNKESQTDYTAVTKTENKSAVKRKTIKRKKQEKKNNISHNSEIVEASEMDSVNKAKKISKEPKKIDYAQKLKDTESKMSFTNTIFSIVNIGLIIAVVVLIITSCMNYREKCHTPVKESDIIITKIPVENNVSGIQIEKYSGVAKNKQMAVIIGNDTFIRPLTEDLKAVKNKSTVKTKRYAITVSYTDNSLLSYIYGDLTFVHHSAIGEGNFSEKDMKKILAFAKKYYTKKRYDFFDFTDKDTIDVSNPPDCMIKEIEKDS